MATSLARQLQSIKSDTVATLDKRKHENLASLLFDPEEAAAQDFHGVFSLGVNGLHGLVQLDIRFQKFDKTLFSETAKEIDRTIQTKSENEGWDKEVNEFLDLVAPHALSREASKALEWLIRRFKIHQFPATAETLLLTFLPYHTEPLYTRLLQIISLPPTFSFLEQYTNIRIAATLPPVPRQHFIRALSRDQVFLEKYSSFLVSRVRSGNGFPAQIVTWTTLVVEAILQMRQARTSEEEIVQKVMPFVAQALQMKTSLEFQIAGYTVLTILASNGTLTAKVVDAAMEAVVLGWTEESRRYGLLCLVTLAQSRDGKDILAESVVQSLVSLEDLVPQVEALPTKAAFGILLVPVAKKLLVSPKFADHQALLSTITFSEKIAVSDRQAIIQAAVTQAPEATRHSQFALGKWIVSCAKEHPEDLKNAVLPILDTLDPKQAHGLESVAGFTLKVLPRYLCAEIQKQSDQEMDEIEYSTPNESESDPWSSLPTELSNPSFFTISPEHSSILDAFANTAKSVSETKLETLLSSDLFTQSPVSIPSFYARVWTTLSYPVRARTIALDHFILHLKEKAPTSDFQGFIPHLIVAISDLSKDVRDAGANALTALHETYPTTSKVTVVGLADLYHDESAGLKWLSTAEAKWLLGNVILPKLAECRLDCNYITRLLGGVLNGAGKKGKKEQNPTAAMVFLASHVVSSGTSSVQYCLLRILNDHSINNLLAIKLKSQSLEPLLLQAKNIDFLTALLNQEKQIDSAEFKDLLVQIVGPGSSAAQIVLLLDIVQTLGPLASPACHQLSIVFPATGQPTQIRIAKTLMTRLENGPPGLAKTVAKTFDAIDLPSPVLLSLLEDVKIEVDPRDSSPARKRQRTESARSSPGTMPEGLVQSTSRLILFLEVLERQHSQYVEIIPPLFDVLDRLIAAENDTRTALNYPKQMVLSCLHSIVRAHKNTFTTPMTAEMFRVDTLIACVRTSTNPQVHNRSLLLLSALAEIVPELILNHVMPIFAFMGANVFRQDDEYSAHVIDRTIKSIVPIVASMSTGGKAEMDTNPILACFVNNFDFIPKHRRLSLFKVLLETLGADSSTANALFLLAETCSHNHEKSKPVIVGFSTDLVNSLALSTRLTTIDSFLRLVLAMSKEDSDDKIPLSVDMKAYSTEKLSALKRNSLEIVTSILESRSHQGGVRQAFAMGDVEIISEDRFPAIIEKLLLISSRSAKDIREVITSAMDGLLSPLPLQFVTGVVETLVKSGTDFVVTTHMISLAAERLTRASSTDLSLKKSLTQLLSLLNDVLRSSQDLEEVIVALNCVGKLSRVYGKAELPLFEAVVPTIIARGFRSEENLVIEKSCDCLLSMLPVLGVKVVPHLPEIVPIALDRLANNDEIATQSAEMSMLHLLTGLFERIPTFMSTYVQRLMNILLQFSGAKDQPVDLLDARNVLMETVTENSSTETCVESLSTCWTKVEHPRKTLEMFITVLEWIIAVGTREDLTGSSRLLFDIFLKIFDIRNNPSLKPKAVKRLETAVTEVFLKLVMKLNDTTFRPFFITFKDWTFRNAVGEDKLNRQIFFYRFMNKFLETLQTVVTAYYGIMLDDTVHLLNEFKQGTTKSKDLWTNMINSLHKSFTHDLDQDAYWSSPTRFDKIVTPLLSQLTLSFKPSVVIPAIVQLASKARSEENLKLINETLMEYMKSDSSVIRLAAIKTQRELYVELTNDWLKMLPPTVPVISETMEDEDDNVIEATHVLIATIEKVGGISMQKLLT